MNEEPNEKDLTNNDKEFEAIEEPTYDPSQTFLTLEDLEEKANNEKA